MKWIGYLSSVVVLNFLFFGFYLYLADRFPTRELGLVWESIFADTSPPAEPAEAPLPPEMPSYEDLLEERLLRSPDISRKIEELDSVRRAIEEDRKRLEAARADLEKIRQRIEGELETSLDVARKQGEQKLLELVTAMKPKQAKEVLLSDGDTDRVLRLILNMDPTSAEKIFREFKEPGEQRILNGWLDRLGQGDPEAARLRLLMEQAKPPATR